MATSHWLLAGGRKASTAFELASPVDGRTIGREQDRTRRARTDRELWLSSKQLISGFLQDRMKLRRFGDAALGEVLAATAASSSFGY